MHRLPPLRFRPILREYLWGGRRLAELGKLIGAGPHYAESWEIVDHDTDQSCVADGPLAGTTLHDLIMQHGEALLGHHHPQERFPLLFKFLDCQRTLSVQVHPNDEQAARLQPPDLGKTEAWVVLDAEPGSILYAGLKPGIDRTALEQAVAQGACDECLHQFEPKQGDCLLIEAGTVHALGGGLLIAEIQQASDTTFRVFDWNRVDRDGKPRPLHVQESLETIDYTRGPAAPVMPSPTERTNVERLIACEEFVLDRWRVDGREQLQSDNQFHFIALLDGTVTISSQGASFELQRGGTLLIPACCHEIELTPQGRAVFLDAYLPG